MLHNAAGYLLGVLVIELRSLKCRSGRWSPASWDVNAVVRGLSAATSSRAGELRHLRPATIRGYAYQFPTTVVSLDISPVGIVRLMPAFVFVC